MVNLYLSPGDLSSYYFFEIPIYRVPLDKYKKEVDAVKEEYLRPINDAWSRWSPEPAEVSEAYKYAENYFDSEHGTHIWRYNQVIGWLRLFTSDRCHIRADYYWVNAKRMTKDLKKKHFRYCFEVKTFELDIFPAMSSNNIYTLLQQHIKELMEQKPFKGRYTDLEMFQNIGPCIDWRALVDA